ncbi:MAG: FAD-binding oxidoreductase [Fibrobacteres bacterium]|nr:FAD-binding oxidoreductase [Fibrobacterota bacterium]
MNPNLRPDRLFCTREDHRLRVERVVREIQAHPGEPLRLAKRTSNLFRSRQKHQGLRLDVADFCHVISIENGRAEVEGMTTFEDFADACLSRGFSPPVVPELKTITVGGAVTGIGIESASFRNGFVHETVEEMDILCGDGVVRTCRADNEHADLYFAFPNSYGTLGYALRLVLRLERALPNVKLSYRRFAEARQLLSELESACAVEGPGRPDFVEAVAFAPDDFVLSLGWRTQNSGPTSPIAGKTPYYLTLREKPTDLLTARDHLWRWDADWFWCSFRFGLQTPWIRALVGRWMLRSSSYWKILTGWRKYRMEEKVRALKKFFRRPDHRREPVIQDVELPLPSCEAFLDFYWKTIDIRPLWLCPIRPLPSKQPWTLYDLPDRLHVNFGFWDSVPTTADLPKDHFNRLLERKVVDLGGHKSLYSTSYFEEDEFWRIYAGDAYRALKAKYDVGRALPDLYAKAVKNR